jgi:BMFP domain-containing protein YqiC
MTTISLTTLQSEVIAKLPTAFQAVATEVLAAVEGQTTDWLTSLLSLATSDTDAAMEQLAAARTNAQAVAGADALAAATDQLATDNATMVAEWKTFFSDAWSATLVVLGAVATVAL